jgi:hypothetical protein
MESAQELEKLARNAQDEAQDEALWTNPANGIINGINKNESVRPVRAIWEMVQNARDQSTNKAHITFRLTEHELIFEHDGQPFEPKTIKALILQTSSKDRSDRTQTGQYGTGFLTTHLFGRFLLLDGALRTIPDTEHYYNFHDFKIDRSLDDKDKLITELKHQCNTAASWAEDSSTWSGKAAPLTSFKFQLSEDYEKQNSSEAMNDAPAITPYVLAFNNKIESITYTENSSTVFASICIEIKEECGNYKVLKFNYKENDELKNLWLLQSKMIIEGSQEPKFTVILPILERDGMLRVKLYNDAIPNLFIYLPLMGTEKWGVNFYIHSPLFTCSTDNRDSLRLVDNGQRYSEVVQTNQDVIKEANDAIIDYLSKHYSELKDNKYLAMVEFTKNTSKDEKLVEYYQDLQNYFISSFASMKLAINVNGNFVAISKLKVLDYQLTEIVNDNEPLLEAIHRLLGSLYTNDDNVPILENLLYWSRTLQGWYGKEGDCFTSIKDLVEYVDDNKNQIDDNDLLLLDKMLAENNCDKYFDSKHLLPTESGERRLINDLKRPKALSDTFRKILDVLLFEDTTSFVKPGFEDIKVLKRYNDENIKTNLGVVITDIQTRQSNKNKTFKDYSQPDIEVYKKVLLSIEVIQALSNFVAMQLEEDSEPFYRKALNRVVAYYSLSLETEEKLGKGKYEERSALRTLICNVLYEFTLLNETEKAEKKDWIYGFIQDIYGSSYFRNILSNYKIYLTLAGNYDWADNLRKITEIPDEMLDVYNNVMNRGNTDDETRTDIRAKVVAKDYEDYFVNNNSESGIEIGSKIYEKMIPPGTSEIDIPTILVQKYKETTLLIIEKIRNKVNDGLWSKSFPQISSFIPKLILLLLPPENSKTLMHLLTKPQKQLDAIIELANDPKCDEIIALGRKALLLQDNDHSDFEYKKKLGNYVEDILKKELEKRLDYIKEIKVGPIDVDNQQKGQDLIVSYDRKPIYYIEVKSRWIKDEYVMMSKTQMRRSVDQRNHYALCAINMTDFNKDKALAHIYPDNIEDTLTSLYVLTDIGSKNRDFNNILDNDESKKIIHIGGDYKSVVPQEVIKNGKKLNDLVKIIAGIIENNLG